LTCSFLGYVSASLMAIIRGGMTCTVSPAAVREMNLHFSPNSREGQK